MRSPLAHRKAALGAAGVLAAAALLVPLGTPRRPAAVPAAPRAALESHRTSVPLPVVPESVAPGGPPVASTAAASAPVVEALRVRVVDHLGEPAAGVRVELATDPARGSAVGVPLAEATTGPDGTARLEAVSADAARRVRVDALLRRPPSVPVPPGATEVVLRLPPAGALRLSAVDERGSPVERPVRFAVFPLGADAEPGPRWVLAERGQTLLRHVGLDLDLGLLASLEGGDVPETRSATRGPSAAGGLRDVTLRFGPPWPLASLRALDEAGRALAGIRLDAELLEPDALGGRSGPGLAWRLRTDDRGRVDVRVRGAATGSTPARVALVHDDGRQRLGCVLELPPGLEPGDRADLGDVVLRPLPSPDVEVTWASGRVLDAGGAPLAGATVLARPARRDGVPGLAASASSAADGAFRLVGPAGLDTLEVRALAPGHAPGAWEAVATGSSGLVLRLARPLHVQGRLLVDAGVPPDALVLVLRGAEEAQRWMLDADRFALEVTGPGPFDLEVRTRTGDWLVERLDGVYAHAAGASPDARLAPLDLRGRLAELDLRLVEPGGDPLERVLVHLEPRPWPEGEAWVRDGRLRAWVPAGAGPIAVRPRGHHPVEVEAPGLPQSVPCQPLP